MAEAQAVDPGTPERPPATRPIERGRQVPWGPIAVTLEIVVIIAVWQFLQGNLEVVNKVFLPAPSEIGETLLAMLQPGFEVVRNTPGDVYTHIGASVFRFVTAFAMAAVLGIALGLLIGGWFPAQKLIAPFVWALYAMPLIAIRPMTTWWFGFGDNPIIFLVFLARSCPSRSTPPPGSAPSTRCSRRPPWSSARASSRPIAASCCPRPCRSSSPGSGWASSSAGSSC